MMAVKVLLLLLYTIFHDSLAIPLDDFYPFGDFAQNESIIGPTLDGSSGPIRLTQIFPFFTESYDLLFVNNNGVISFNTPFSAFLPRNFPLLTRAMLVAPFWADSDTRINGTVWYSDRSGDQEILTRAENEIRQYFPSQQNFTAIFVFVATWDEVPHFLNGDLTNTYQCVLISDGIQSFTIFLYADDMIEWTTGDETGSGGLDGRQAEIGYDAGDGVNFERLPVSGTAEVINIASLSNVGVDGVWAFSLSGDQEDEENLFCDFDYFNKDDFTLLLHLQ